MREAVFNGCKLLLHVLPTEKLGTEAMSYTSSCGGEVGVDNKLHNVEI